MNNSSEYLMIKEIAPRFNVSESWIRKMINKGELKCYRAGRKILIQPKDLKAALTVMEPVKDLVSDYLS